MFIFHAQAITQAETLFFQRTGYPQLLLMFGDDAARQHARMSKGIDIA